MDFKSYSKALLAEPFDELVVEGILDTYYHAGSPFVFRGDAAAQAHFARNVANEIATGFGISCHPHDIVICGSAHLGFSAAPNEKLGKPFNFTDSDIDIAILLPELFDRWWLELAAPKVMLYKRHLVASHLLNGYINPRLVRDFTRTGKQWWELFRRLKAGGLKRVRGRIYRSPQFMQNYHRLSVVRGREKLLGAKA